MSSFTDRLYAEYRASNGARTWLTDAMTAGHLYAKHAKRAEGYPKHQPRPPRSSQVALTTQPTRSQDLGSRQLALDLPEPMPRPV